MTMSATTNCLPLAISLFVLGNTSPGPFASLCHYLFYSGFRLHKIPQSIEDRLFGVSFVLGNTSPGPIRFALFTRRIHGAPQQLASSIILLLRLLSASELWQSQRFGSGLLVKRLSLTVQWALPRRAGYYAARRYSVSALGLRKLF